MFVNKDVINRNNYLKFNSLFVLFFFSLAAVASEIEKPKTKEDTNREVIRTYAQVYLGEKDFATAENMIATYLASDAQDSNLWNLLGLTQLELKKYSQACFAFKKASELASTRDDQMIYLYNFADALNRGGRTQDSILVLTQIAEKYADFSDFIKRLILEIKAGAYASSESNFPILKRQAKGKIRVSGALGAGYDTNATLMEEDIISGSATRDHASAFVTPAFQLGYLGQLFGKPLDTRYLATFSGFSATAAHPFNSLYQRADALIGSEENRYGLFSEVYFLNRDPFQLYFWNAGLNWIKVKRVSDEVTWEFETPLRFQKFSLDSESSSDNDRTGVDLQLKLTHRKWQGANQYQISQFILEQQQSSGKNYRYTGLSIPYTLAVPISFFEDLHISNTFSAAIAGQWYWQTDPSRKDFSAKLGTGFMKSFSGNWNLAFDLSIFKNLSSISAARYSKGVVSLMLSHEFW